MKKQITIPVSIFNAMCLAANNKLHTAKNLIIEENEISYILLTQPYQGETTVAAHATKPKSVLPGANATG